MSEQKRKSGAWRVFLVVLVLLSILVGIGIYRAFNPTVSVPKESVLVMTVEGDLPEAVLVSGFPPFTSATATSFQDLLSILEKAKRDERVKMILVNVSGLNSTWSKLMELREEIATVRASGKEVWAHFSGVATDKEYFLASACDKIYIERYGVLAIDGISTERVYYKNLLSKIGIAYEVSRRGKYKSATEDMIKDSMTTTDFEQRKALLEEFHASYLAGVAKDRLISETNFQTILNTTPYLSDEEAVKKKLVDSALTFSDVKEVIRKKYSKSESDDKSFFIGQSDYREAQVGKTGGSKIAVVQIMGGIMDGKSFYNTEGGGSTGDETLVPAIEAARKDESVKAIILRVDSPGGSAIASDKILMALNKAKLDKPVIVSMSGVAASGGYWVALNGTKIVAHPSTITGSIGIYATKPYFKELSDKIGLKRSVISMDKYADAFNVYDKLSPEAYKQIDNLIDYGYQTFLKKVSDGRHMKVADIDSIAQGRVWTGRKAKELGLVDELGGFRKAIAVAKEAAKLDAAELVSLVSYPAKIDFFDSFTNDEDEDASIVAQLTASFKAEALKELFGTTLLPEEFKQLTRSIDILSRFSPLQPLALMPFEIMVK
jgi:protease IV